MGGMKLVKDLTYNKMLYIEDSVYNANPDNYFDYTDRPLYWYRFYEEVCDFWTAQDALINIYNNTGWAALDDDERDVMARFRIGDEVTEIIPFLMGYYSLSQQEAQQRYLSYIGECVERKSKVSTARLESSVIVLLLYSYLDSNDAESAYIEALNHIIAYKDKTYLGTQYGNALDGIMDYVEGTGSYSSGTGLSKYPIKADVVSMYPDEATAKADMIAKIKDWLLKQRKDGEYIVLNIKY